MAHATHPNIEDVTLPEVMNAMSDPIRLGLIKLLSDGEERAWGQLDAPVAPSTLSYHLKSCVVRVLRRQEWKERAALCD